MNMIFPKTPTNALDKIPNTILVRTDEFFLSKIKTAFLSPETRFLLSVETSEVFPWKSGSRQVAHHYELKALGNAIRWEKTFRHPWIQREVYLSLFVW